MPLCFRLVQVAPQILCIRRNYQCDRARDDFHFHRQRAAVFAVDIQRKILRQFTARADLQRAQLP